MERNISGKAGKALSFHHIHIYCIGMFRVLPFLSTNHALYPNSCKTSYVHNVCFLLLTENWSLQTLGKRCQRHQLKGKLTISVEMFSLEILNFEIGNHWYITLRKNIVQNSICLIRSEFRRWKKKNQPKNCTYHPVVYVRYQIKLFDINNIKEMSEVRNTLCSD